MTRFKLTVGAAALVVASFVGVQAKANPVTIGYSLNNNSTIVQLDTGNGSAGVTGYRIGAYTISLSATGSPTLVNPNFGSNTLSVRSDRGNGGTIYLYATERNDTAMVPSFNLGLSNNPLSDTSVTESVYADDANGKFALTTLLGSAALAPGDVVSVNAPFGSLSAPYSLTEVYKITFGTDGGVVDATILEKANVPEPMSLSLLGAGLAGLGFVRLRRKA